MGPAGMKRLLAAVLGLATLLTVAWVVVPMFLIHPFKPQTPTRLAVGHALRIRSATVTLVLLALGLLAVYLLWRRLASWRGRVPAVLAVLLLAGAAVVGRWNMFESMFNPLPDPRFAGAAGASGVTDEDLVLGVRLGGEAKAYPVRALAYHHLVNDVVAGEPIVATY